MQTFIIDIHTDSYLIFCMKIDFTSTLHRIKKGTELLINFFDQMFQRIKPPFFDLKKIM